MRPRAKPFRKGLRMNKKDGFGFVPKAVLFDMDGVIYDSMKYHAKAWHTTMTRFGIPMSEEDCYAHEGMRGLETIKKLAHERCGLELSPDEIAHIYDKKCKCFASFPKPEMMPGTKLLMEKIKTTGAKIVVVTGSGQLTVLNRLERDYAGLVNHDLMVTCFDVEHGKPMPDPYLMGLKKAGVTAAEAIVVENAPLGIRAGKAAGIFTVAVNTGPLPDSMLAAEGADIVLPSMQHFADIWEKLIH